MVLTYGTKLVVLGFIQSRETKNAKFTAVAETCYRGISLCLPLWRTIWTKISHGRVSSDFERLIALTPDPDQGLRPLGLLYYNWMDCPHPYYHMPLGYKSSAEPQEQGEKPAWTAFPTHSPLFEETAGHRTRAKGLDHLRDSSTGCSVTAWFRCSSAWPDSAFTPAEALGAAPLDPH